MTLWHYTTEESLIRILASGEIRPATAGVPTDERPIVWFSSNQLWEPTSAKVLYSRTLNMAEMRMFVGLARIGVSPDVVPYDWHALKRHGGMKSRMVKGLEKAALRLNARPEEWFGTFEPVPRARWIAVEIFPEGKW